MLCQYNIQKLNKSDIRVKGVIEDIVKGGKIVYVAAAPADHRASYTGSGLPFANQLQAFDNTPNRGEVILGPHNSFEIDLIMPNSYMVGLGSVKVPPTLYVEYVNREDEVELISIRLSEGIPYRTMTWPMDPRARSGADFYDSQFYLEVRSQEKILRDAGYPRTNTMPSNHWGTKPPL
jgi:hypothetical protein